MWRVPVVPKLSKPRRLRTEWMCVLWMRTRSVCRLGKQSRETIVWPFSRYHPNNIISHHSWRDHPPADIFIMLLFLLFQAFKVDPAHLNNTPKNIIPDNVARTSEFMTHHNFNRCLSLNQAVTQTFFVFFWAIANTTISPPPALLYHLYSLQYCSTNHNIYSWPTTISIVQTTRSLPLTSRQQFNSRHPFFSSWPPTTAITQKPRCYATWST